MSSLFFCSVPGCDRHWEQDCSCPKPLEIGDDRYHHRATVGVSFDLFLLMTRQSGDLVEVVSNDIPADARFVTSSYDPSKDLFVLVLEHPSFPAVLYGSHLTQLQGPVLRKVNLIRNVSVKASMTPEELEQINKEFREALEGFKGKLITMPDGMTVQEAYFKDSGVEKRLDGLMKFAKPMSELTEEDIASLDLAKDIEKSKDNPFYKGER